MHPLTAVDALGIALGVPIEQLTAGGPDHGRELGQYRVFIRAACQHAGPDVCPLPTTKHPAEAIGAAPEPAAAAGRPDAEPLPSGAR